FGVTVAGARMVGRIHGKIARQRVMEFGPLRTPSAMQKNQRRARTRDLHVRLYLVVPNVDDAFLCSGHGLLCPFSISAAYSEPGAGWSSRRRACEELAMRLGSERATRAIYFAARSIVGCAAPGRAAAGFLCLSRS